MFEKMNEEISKLGVIPVIVIEDAKNAVPLAEALEKAGLKCAEVTFRTDAAEESIRQISEHFPDMLVGAGTVLTKENLSQQRTSTCWIPWKKPRKQWATNRLSYT